MHYDKQRHFHGLAYRRLNSLQLNLLRLEQPIQPSDDRQRPEDVAASQQSPKDVPPSGPRTEDIEQLFFIPQDFSGSVTSAKDPRSESEEVQEVSPEALAEFFDLLPY